MKSVVGFGAVLLVFGMLTACSKDEKSSAERDKEIQKVLQEGAQKEQQMYQGMQKAAENMEKSVQGQKEEKK